MLAPVSTSPQSVDRIFAVLEYLASHKTGAGLAELARTVDAPKSSLTALLAGMLERGHLVKDDAGLYRLGPRMFSMAMRIVGSLDLASLARPILERLSADTGETSLLGALAPAGNVAIYIDKVESTSALRYTISLGEERELYCSSIGKLLLAHMPPAQQQAYFKATPLKSFTDTTITTAAAMRRELDTILAQGYAQTRGERIVGAHAIAAPVFGYEGEMLAALVVVGPAERMRAGGDQHRARLLAAAKQLSQHMSARDPAPAA